MPCAFLVTVEMTTSKSVRGELGGLKLGEPFTLDQIDKKFSLVDLVGDFKDGIKYEGSLTSPPCAQNVIWLLKADPVSVAQDFISLYAIGVQQQANVRGLQPLNGRTLCKFAP